MTTFIRYPNKLLRLTAEDKLWTARMIDAEGAGTESEAILLLWAMIQRKYWGVGPYTVDGPEPRAFGGDTWTQFVRKFSQPLNPSWYRDGVYCRPGGRDAGTPPCEEKRLAARERWLHRSYRSLDPVARRVTEMFMAGQLPRPDTVIGVLDWRANDGRRVSAPQAKPPFRTGNRYFYNISGISENHPMLASIRFVVNGVEQPIINPWSPATVVPSPPPGPGGALLQLVPGAVTGFNLARSAHER